MPSRPLARDGLDRVLSIAGRSLRFNGWAFATFVLGAALSIGYAVKRPRVFKSETLILYRENIRSSALGEDSGAGDPARKLGMRLKEVVLSRTRLSQIIEEAKLYPAIVEDRGYVDAVDEMRSHIAFRVRDGDTFGLSFEGADPKQVQAVTARLAEALIEENSKHRVEQATVTKDFLDGESGRVEGELKEKETELARFLAAHPEFAREGSPTAMRQPKASTPSTPRDGNLLALERESARIEARLGLPPRKNAPVAPESKAMQEATAELASAQRDLADKQSRFTDQHPDVRTARGHVEAAAQRLARVRASEPGDAPMAALEEGVDDEERAELQSELQRLRVDILTYRSHKHTGPAQDAEKSEAGASRIVALETEWTQRSREVADAQQRRAQLEDKQFKASIAASSVSSEHNAQITIVDPAFLPTHAAKPGRTTVAGAGLFASLLLALAVALLSTLADDRLFDRVDVERVDLIPLAAEVPRPTRRERRSLRRAIAQLGSTDRVAKIAGGGRG